MKLIDEFSIYPIKGHWSDNEQPRSSLVHKRHNTGALLDGVYLQAQCAFENKYILFLTEDCPYEEVLNIYVLDQSYSVLDRASIDLMYNTGQFGGLLIESYNQLSFSFYSDERWILTILPKPRRTLTLGIHHLFTRPASFFFKRYLTLHKKDMNIAERFIAKWF